MQLFKPQYEVEECLAALRQVLESGWTGYGPLSFQFEKNWSTYVGSSHSLYVNSATSALHIALRMCDLPAHSAVISTPLTFLAPNAVILYKNHIPIFADINEETLSIDAEDCLNKIEKYSVKAGIWVHYAGNVSADFYTAAKALQTQGIPLIEDCAHAAGAYYQDGSRVGSSPNTTSCFSYHSIKNLPTFDSGMLCTPSESIAKRARRLAYFGLDRDAHKRLADTTNCKWNYEVAELGWKYNGNDVAAAIANVQLNYLQRDNDYRRQLYERYHSHLGSCPNVQFLRHETGSSHHLMVVRVKNREEVMKAFQEKKIIFGTHQRIDDSPSVFSKFYRHGNCPIFERVSSELLCLPNHLKLSPQDVDIVCEILHRVAKS